MVITTYDQWYERILQGHEKAEDASAAARAVLALSEQLGSSDLKQLELAALRFVCSSLVINAGADLSDLDFLSQGQSLASLALEGTTPDDPLHFQCLYNQANAIVAACDIGLPKSGSREEQIPNVVENRRLRRRDLRDARKLLLEVASSSTADHHTRSAAYCNLANCLDHSGRWAEAYDFYLRALEADPTNGNAAGNLSQLLLNRIHSGVGQTGHIAAVHDKYLRMAQSLREGTIEFAGEDTADRWDESSFTDSPGHLSHGLDSGDEYRQWVSAYRLALSPAVEGLGTEGAHWDSAVLQNLYGSREEHVSPPILAELNVLKSDYLVSRQLAFDGSTQVAEGPQQKNDDSGYYVETLDYSLYGVQYSRLFLAQRSALDVLDKTAVVANDYFKTGDEPRKISFRKFWTELDGHVRDDLVKAPGRSLPPFALSELAFDMENAGMYAPSQALRNAGTHRIVHAAVFDATGVTVNARSRVDFVDLVDSTILALQVTRSAFLYLLDLVASWNHPDDHPGFYQPVRSFEYMDFPDAEDDTVVPSE